MIWIRSQDRKMLMEVESLDVIEDYDSEMWEIVGEYTLGAYSSEEKAIKVLDEIQKRITIISLAERDRDSHMFSGQWFPRDNFVFQMPKDEEVEA